MAHIDVKQGLDIPMAGAPQGEVVAIAQPAEAALSLHPFEHMRFKMLVKVGDEVKRGQALCYDKGCPSRKFVSPAAGKVKKLVRGLKRRLLNIVIEVDASDASFDHGKLNVSSATREQLVEKLCEGGIFGHLRQRPFDIPANPESTPRTIFVKAVETAPFETPAEMQVLNHEDDFKIGLEALSKLTEGDVNLVYHSSSACPAFTQAEHCKRHTVSGPHPAGNVSVHIHHIDPVQSPMDVIWTATVNDVVGIGHLLRTGHVYSDRIIGIAGNGINPEFRQFVRGRLGHPIGALLAGRNAKGTLRLISGNPLTGKQVTIEDYLQQGHHTLTVLPEETEREFMHFFRLGGHKFTASRTYLSGHLPGGSREYDFTTNNHGEHRGFVDAQIYQNVMPMNVPVMYLVKAIQAEDFDRAEALGLLEVSSEDFALPTFVCPCKIEICEIVEGALHNAALEHVH